MKKWVMAVSALVMVAGPAGCSSDYVMATKDGNMILTQGKPRSTKTLASSAIKTRKATTARLTAIRFPVLSNANHHPPAIARASTVALIRVRTESASPSSPLGYSQERRHRRPTDFAPSSDIGLLFHRAARPVSANKKGRPLMQYHRIPHSSLEVSVLGLGTMTFGEQNSEADAHAQLDCIGRRREPDRHRRTVPGAAPPGNPGPDRELYRQLAQARGNREKIVRPAKSRARCGTDSSIRPQQASIAKHPRRFGRQPQAAEHRLSRSLLHWPQRATNCFGKLNYQYTDDKATVTLLETLEALTEQVRTGKIRYIGVSNETPRGVMRYLQLAEKHELPRIVSIQNPYSLLNRSFEIGTAEISQHEGVELLAYSSGVRYSERQIPQRR